MAGSVPVEAPDAWPGISRPGGAPLPGELAPGSPGVLGASAAPAEPLADPDLDDPAKAAMQYRRLLGASDTARAQAGRDARHRRQGNRALARRHRDAAEEIRARVRGVWGQVAEPLAQYGLTELDQLRPAVGDAATDGPSARPSGEPAASGRVVLAKRRGTGRSLAAEADGRHAGRPVATAGRGADGSGAGGSGAGGRAVGRARTRQPRDGQPEPAGAVVDPRTAPRQAYEYCLEAMSKAAELRAVSKASGSASAGLLTALGCLLTLVVVGLLRAFASAPALPCLVGAALAAGVLVAAGAGGGDGGAGAAVRAGILGAGTAAVTVLATFRLAPVGPVGVVGSLIALVAAVRFGFGLSDDAGPAAAGGAGAGGFRKGGSRKG